jgi:hypothetical protein
MSFSSSDKFDIPENDIGKIIYYLHCVCECIDYNDIDIDSYKNFRNCSSLSFEDQEFLFFLSLNLSPDLLIGTVFYPNDRFYSHPEQRFYKIDQIGCSTILPSSLTIAGRTCSIKKIFIFQQKWLNQYYLEPMNRLSIKFHSQKRSKKRSNTI